MPTWELRMLAGNRVGVGLTRGIMDPCSALVSVKVTSVKDYINGIDLARQYHHLRAFPTEHRRRSVLGTGNGWNSSPVLMR